MAAPEAGIALPPHIVSLATNGLRGLHTDAPPEQALQEQFATLRKREAEGKKMGPYFRIWPCCCCGSVPVEPADETVARILPKHLVLGLEFGTVTKFIRTELAKVHPAWGQVGLSNRDLPAGHVRSIRSDYPESLFWIAKQYGDRLTGYDVAEATKVWLRINDAEDKSVCEVLKEREWKGVDEAEVFLSHVQAESPSETLRAMWNIDERRRTARRGTKHANSKIWVDYFCLRQLRNDFKTEQVEQLIRKTGAVYVHMDGAETGNSYSTRSLCVFETIAAIEGKATLMINTPGTGPLTQPECSCWPCCICCDPMPNYTIDAAAATAFREDDEAKVDQYIVEGPGFARVNQLMERELRRSAVLKSWSCAVFVCCFPCVFTGLCFDVCCPRCNPCGWVYQIA